MIPLTGRWRDQRGQAAIEFVGLLPLLLVAAMFAWQILIVGYTATSTTNAARTASRVATRDGDAEKAATEALPGVLREGAKAKVDGTRVTLEVAVPILMPGVRAGSWKITKAAELPGG